MVDSTLDHGGGAAALAAGTAALILRSSPGQSRPTPSPVQPGDREIVWLSTATNASSWERFVAAVQRAGRRLQADHPGVAGAGRRRRLPQADDGRTGGRAGAARRRRPARLPLVQDHHRLEDARLGRGAGQGADRRRWPSSAAAPATPPANWPGSCAASARACRRRTGRCCCSPPPPPTASPTRTHPPTRRQTPAKRTSPASTRIARSASASPTSRWPLPS